MSRIRGLKPGISRALTEDVLEILKTFGESSALQVSLQTGHDTGRVLSALEALAADGLALRRHKELDPQFQPFALVRSVR